jgi:hypothetical protein
MRQYFASDYAYGNGNVRPLKVDLGTTTTGAATSYILYDSTSVAAPPSQDNFSPLNINAPVLVGTGTTQETLTPSAVTNLPVGQSSTVTFTPTNQHGNGTLLASGTAGLQEALNMAASQNGGAVIVDGKWAQYGGTTAMITSAAVPTGSPVFILDLRGADLNTYASNGTAFIATGGAFSPGANGQSFVPFTNTENLTLSTSAATTSTVGNLLPANSIIMGVNGTVSTTIATATNWQLGDATTAGRFSAVDSTLTKGESVPKASFPPVQIGTGVASATTGVYQAAAAKVVVTTTGSQTTAGAVRITVWGFTMVNATS